MVRPMGCYSAGENDWARKRGALPGALSEAVLRLAAAGDLEYNREGHAGQHQALKPPAGPRQGIDWLEVARTAAIRHRNPFHQTRNQPLRRGGSHTDARFELLPATHGCF